MFVAAMFSRCRGKGWSVRYEDARDTARRLRQFTYEELAQELGVGVRWLHATGVVPLLLEREVVRAAGVKLGGHGRPPKLFEVIRSCERSDYRPVNRERRPPPEIEAVARERAGRGRPVTGPKVNRAARRRLREFEQANGVSGYRIVSVGKHGVQLEAPNGSRVSISKTPSDHRADRNAVSQRRTARAA
jgi:hypothetical protein